MTNGRKTTILLAGLLSIIACGTGVGQETSVSKQCLNSNKLTGIACDGKAATEKRSAAIRSLAKLDDWQALSRILVWVTREHNNDLRRFHDENPKAFAQNVGDIQSLPIPEFFVIEELVRINNPGALPYLNQYKRDRFSLPVTNLSGESHAVIENSIEHLSETLLSWSPIEDSKSVPKSK